MWYGTNVDIANVKSKQKSRSDFFVQLVRKPEISPAGIATFFLTIHIARRSATWSINAWQLFRHHIHRRLPPPLILPY